MTPIKIIWLEPTDTEKRWLRRYSLTSNHKCDSTGFYCNAMVEFGEAPYQTEEFEAPPKADPRWPAKCDGCGLAFKDTDPYQPFSNRIYVNKETGLRTTLREAPPGSCWDADWIAKRHTPEQRGSGWWVGPDGRCLIVRCPDGHDWMVDSRASNCTMPDEDTHFCWVRHGRPEDGTLHVDKNGHTCAAGAGSILTPKWHGFLRNGYLVE